MITDAGCPPASITSISTLSQLGVGPLPTGVHCVTDIVTERCYFEVTKDGLVLRELAEGYSVEDILACTEADVIVPDEIGVMS